MAEAPLTGLRVLDFSWGMPGGLATLVLSDFGADVTKVEPPAGDPFRKHPAWRMWNRGKKGIVLDLKTEQDREQAQRLAKSADVLLEAFRPGVAARLGIRYEALAEANPGLIYCSISGFGQTGPLAHVKGYEGVVAAKAGRMMTFEEQVPRPGPVYAAVPVASWAASQAAVHGILAALRVRKRTGAGQWVQTSLLQGTIPYDIQAFMVRQFVRMFPDKYDGDPIVNLRKVATLQYLPVRCKDGRWLQLANNNFRLFQSTIRAMGLWDIYRDERFKSAPDLTPENREALREIILERMQEKTADEWMQIFIEDGDVAAEPFLDAQEGMNHPQFQHNGHAVHVGEMTQLGLLAHLSDTPGAAQGPAPGLGQHTGHVLAALTAGASRTDTHARKIYRGEVAPLAGIIVLEFATVIAGPYAASLLADLGARVIKVEPPGGDLMRQLSGGLGGGAVKTTAGKESIEIDMKAPEGIEIVRKLIAKADVLLHNFRPGVPERLGMDYAAAKALNPKLIYVYAAGYGSTGPHSLRPAFHPLPGALFGGVLRQAGSGTPPPPDQKLSLDEVREVSRRLFRANEANPDPNTSMAITTAILLALHARERTGRGQEVETSMLMANAYANADEAYWYEGRPPTAMPDPDCFGLDRWYRLYRARDGWVFLACPFEQEREAFRRVAGSDPAEGLFLDRTAGEWEAVLTAADVACVRADRTVAEFFDDDPHPRANGLVVKAEHQRFGTYERYGPLVHFSEAETRHGPGVLRGQHTKPLLAELGYTLEEIEDYLARGVVFQEAP